jgi:hypothetical protein
MKPSKPLYSVGFGPRWQSLFCSAARHRQGCMHTCAHNSPPPPQPKRFLHVRALFRVPTDVPQALALHPKELRTFHKYAPAGASGTVLVQRDLNMGSEAFNIQICTKPSIMTYLSAKSCHPRRTQGSDFFERLFVSCSTSRSL